MSDIRIFIDFGSTFTKVVAFDLAEEELIARVQVPSTVDRDITIGLEEALAGLSGEIGVGEAEKRQAMACSSAAGGLRVVCVGLVAEYTTEAARMAALGAGAKLVGVYSFELSKSEVAEIEEINPDIVLLTGGTDGGNKKVIIHNARMLAKSGSGVSNIIVAGNKSAYDDVRDVYAGAGKNVIYTKNVMPEIGILDVEPSNRQIRDLFINRITEAKGMARVKSIISGVIMPTPAAVFEAARLMADGIPGSPGLGELILVDVGGATTDVYSIAGGAPTANGVNQIGLPEPYAKRTVEGDLGLVHNLQTLREIAGAGEIPAGFDETVRLFREANRIPTGDEQVECHLLLSHWAVRTAVDRHVGRIETRVYPNGEMLMQRGKDLTRVRWVVGSGGPVSFARDPRRVLEGALFQASNPALLKPKAPEMLVDRHYILFALGLLAQSEPARALNMIRKYITQL